MMIRLYEDYPYQENTAYIEFDTNDKYEIKPCQWALGPVIQFDHPIGYINSRYSIPSFNTPNNIFHLNYSKEFAERKIYELSFNKKLETLL